MGQGREAPPDPRERHGLRSSAGRHPDADQEIQRPTGGDRPLERHATEHATARRWGFSSRLWAGLRLHVIGREGTRSGCVWRQVAARRAPGAGVAGVECGDSERSRGQHQTEQGEEQRTNRRHRGADDGPWHPRNGDGPAP